MRLVVAGRYSPGNDNTGVQPQTTAPLETDSGAEKLELLKGYAVAIYYFSLANAQLAIRRVKLRVALGGHNVPSDIVKRRFGRSLRNFFALYAPLADEWTLFDNSSSPQALPVATQFANQLTVTETATWHKLQKLSKVV